MAMQGKMRRLIWIFVLAAAITACGKPRPLTFEEQQAYMANQQCQQEATNMNSGFPGFDNPYWTSYYVMCMQSLGISNAAINRMIW